MHLFAIYSFALFSEIPVRESYWFLHAVKCLFVTVTLHVLFLLFKTPTPYLLPNLCELILWVSGKLSKHP